MIKKRTFKVYIFRHGQTYFNRAKIFTGWKESKLTPLGVKQAKTIAKLLKNKRIDVAFYTKLSRSKDTLREVLRFHPECKKKVEDNRIIERSYGILEGTPHEEFIKKIGHQKYDLEVQGDAIENLNRADRKKLQRFLGEKEYEAIHRGYNVAVPGGESFADVEKRVRSFIVYLRKFIRKNKVNVAISAHGNSIRLFRKIMEGASKKQVVKWNIPYDNYFEYDFKI
jgi:2,3-bisphosphoglycerate-dependent phosphoglycerate mutase